MQDFSVSSMILWEDQDLVAISKPSGLLTIEDGYNKELPDLKGLLKAKYEQIYTVHRLDKETSGIIIFAKNADAHRQLSKQFEERCIKKVYHALINRIPEWNEIWVEAPLLINGDRKHRTVSNELLGKPAKTNFSLIAATSAGALISAQPFSGYRHQIRAHLRHIGLSILRDELYASKEIEPQTSTLPITRLALHAFSISLAHPATHENMTLSAPYPEDFQLAASKITG